jgi:hypothetical protein
MAIDSSIALGVRPLQLENPLSMYGTVANIQNAQNQNALAQYTLAAARRGEESENALNKAYMEAYNPQTGQIDLATLRGKIATAGVGSKLPAIEKQLAEVEKEQLARQEQLGKLVNQKFDQSKGLLANVRTREQYIAWHKANHADPVLGKYLESRGITAESSLAQIMAELAQPGGLERLIARSATALDKMPALLDQEREQAILGGRAPTPPMAAPATNALAPAAPQAQLVTNAMVAPVQTAAVPTPAVTAMPATSGLQGELSAVNSEIARLAGSEAAGLPGVQSRIKALEEQKARIYTAINQATQAETSAKQANIASFKFTSTPNGVVKTNVLTGETELVRGLDGRPMKDVAAAQAAEAARSNAEREKLDRARLGLEGERVALQRQANARAAEQIPLQQAFDTNTKSLVFVDRADIRANPDRYKPVIAEEKLRNIPETINKGLTGNVASIFQIDRAIDAVTKTPNAVGLKGNLPQTILNKADPAGVEARALVTDVGSAKVHDRSGAAVAASEAPRLMPFIPQATDDSETVVKKLKQLKTQIEIEQSGILDFYSPEQGYKPSLYHKKQDAPTESVAPAAAKPAAADIGSLPPKVTKDGATYVLQPNGKYIKQ